MVYVVIFAVELNQLGLEVGAYASKYVAQVVDHFFGNTLRRYLVTKTKCTCILNTRFLPSLMKFSSLID